MPKVSIIMPTFNRSWIIERAINCVFSQTMSDFELIVVDDKSTDDTLEKLQRIKDKRLIVHPLDVNKKPAGARNEGLKLAQGEIIAYLDSDNLWYANYLEVMIEELSSFYVMAYCAQNTFLVAGKKDQLKVIARRIRDNPFNPESMMHTNFIDVNCAIHRREVLDEVNVFDESLDTLEDWDLFARIVIMYPFKVKYVSQVLGEYYFFLKETETTSVNSFLSNAQLLALFDIRLHHDRNTQNILNKLNKLLGKR
jgi:glycosyltransferase involved in cell wall biosynthesis